MADNNDKKDIRTLVAQFRESDHWAVSLARDILWVVTVVGGSCPGSSSSSAERGPLL